MDSLFSKLSVLYDLPPYLLREYSSLFKECGIPVNRKLRHSKNVNRIVMVSTHGYWENPPPTGLPDTGGQTYYVLEVSKAWARQGKQVIILARWFEPYPRIETLAKNLWLIRMRAGGSDFVRKEDIYSLVPQMAEASTAIAALFGAQGVVGHYADGMANAVEVGERLNIPVIVIPHSLGIRKVKTLGFDPSDPEAWFDTRYNFWTREDCEIAALRGANLEIANTPREPEELKNFYGLDVPNVVMPAGAGRKFFEAFDNRPDPAFLSEYGLMPKKYMIFFGRISESKNVPNTVAVLGEAKRLAPKLFKDIKLVIAGGSRHHLLAEEQLIEDKIRDNMKTYGLSADDVVRIYGNLNRATLTAMVYHSLCYIGMQLMEPFGMSAAEAMAAGTPILISAAAGITKWLEADEEALIVDPAFAPAAAEKLVTAMDKKGALKKVALNGRRKAKKDFSWEGIARQQGKLFEELAGKGAKKNKGRAYHRNIAVWKEPLPIITDHHRAMAKGLLPPALEAFSKKRPKNTRAVINISDIPQIDRIAVLEYLKYLLRKDGLWTVTIDGTLMAPHELSAIIKSARAKTCTEIMMVSESRIMGNRRYENVPVDLTHAEGILIYTTHINKGSLQ